MDQIRLVGCRQMNPTSMQFAVILQGRVCVWGGDQTIQAHISLRFVFSQLPNKTVLLLDTCF